MGTVPTIRLAMKRRRQLVDSFKRKYPGLIAALKHAQACRAKKDAARK